MPFDRDKPGPLTPTASLRASRTEHELPPGGPAVGDVIAGKYRIDRVLGAGGMGVVVAAYHLHLEIPVAIKFLLRSSFENQQGVERFGREARAAAKITNEHVARVLDVGTLDTGAPYIVLEFLDGSDLATRLREEGPLPIEEAVECVLQACEVLAEAHSLGIVHRDLKPANLFGIRRPDALPWIKVLDFGISKVLSPDGGMSMTQTAAIMGSPQYMSPEQMESSRGVDHRTDIWSLGVVLYELLAGVPPFVSDSLPGLALKIVSQPVPPLRDLRADCPAQLEQAVLKCLERDRDRRFSDVAELAVALLPFAGVRGRVSAERISRVAHGDGSSRTSNPAGGNAASIRGLPSRSGDTQTALGTTTGGRSRRPRGPVLVIGVVVTLLGILVSGLLFVLSRARPAPASAATPASATPPATEAATATGAPSSISLTPLPAAVPDAAPEEGDRAPSPAHESPEKPVVKTGGAPGRPARTLLPGTGAKQPGSPDASKPQKPRRDDVY